MMSNLGPTRVVEFLRGQKVPLHLRNRVPIVLLKHAESNKKSFSDTTMDSPLITDTSQKQMGVSEEVRSFTNDFFFISKFLLYSPPLIS